MNRPSSDTTTPGEPPADPSESAGGSANGADFDWTVVVPLIHPVKVAIIEAMHYIGRPLSATDLCKSFGGGAARLSYVSYHVRTLADAGLIEKVSERQVRGAKETFYRLP